jgi:hypothetical protein
MAADLDATWMPTWRATWLPTWRATWQPTWRATWLLTRMVLMTWTMTQFATWLLTWQLTWTTGMTWTMTWHDDVEFLGPLCDRPYSSSGPHFGPEFQPAEINSAHEKYPSHLTNRIIDTKIFHTEFSPHTIKFST